MPKYKTGNIKLDNLESKYSLLIKFGQFMSHYKRKNFKIFYKNCSLKTSSRPFSVCKEWSIIYIGKWPSPDTALRWSVPLRISSVNVTKSTISNSAISTRKPNQRFLVRVWLVAIRRGEISVIIAWSMSVKRVGNCREKLKK